MAATLARPRVVTAVRALLMADATLAVLLKGVFTEGDVPPGTAYSYLTILADERPFDTLGSGAKFGSDVSLQIKFVTNQSNTDGGDAVLDRMLALLHQQRLTVVGYGSAESAFEFTVEPYSEMVAGEKVKHMPSIWNVTVHQQG